jgi:2,5-dihydroxypyridine 5,6-dioxygenase
MLSDHIEGKWVKCFADVFGLCAVKPGDVVSILSETQSRKLNVHLAELALVTMGARPFHIVVPTPPQAYEVPIRSTGTSLALQGVKQIVDALASSNMVVDCTVEGLLHARELPAILAGGTRVMMISNEHPEVLERLMPDPQLRAKVRAAVERLDKASEMRVTSRHGTDLTVSLIGAPARGAAGFVDEPGKLGYWPAGLCVAFPRSGSVRGRLVLAPGDANLTFKRYVETPVTLVVEGDYVTAVEGTGLDAEMTRSYYEAWHDPAAYAVSHVGWGLNPRARWDAMVMYDKRDINGTELRAFAGNFLFSTGANETANRFTACHFDFPMRECTVALDGQVVVDRGRLLETA